ncbi:MAG: CTP synthase [Chitinophagia bacterium]|nr:CTP synthase [Chitinophagia bacterium]
MTKHIFITGGVTSSLGKGIIAASLAKLLQARGYRVTIQKFDPYLNVDPGTLNPFEHGECYVTEDGVETDLDLGHYERFLNTHTSRENNVTTGSIYQTVILQERDGYYKGKTVQIVPHVTNEIKVRMRKLEEKKAFDIIITELGGTVGDIESFPFIEAVRQMKWEMPENCIVVHLTLLPYLKAAKEIKTKPTQHSVKMLSQQGINPDVLVCRTEVRLATDLRKKLALFCNVKLDSVIEAMDADSIYRVPFLMLAEKLDVICLTRLGLPVGEEPTLPKWRDFLYKLKHPKHKITVGLIGKYVELQDAYKSIIEALLHAGTVNECEVELKYIQSEYLTVNNIIENLQKIDAVLVAPGFGSRGMDGKIEAIRHARENNIPFLGICLGMQMACVEFARNVLKIPLAHSTEMDPNTENAVITQMESQKKVKQQGGSEFNLEFADQFQQAGFIPVGFDAPSGLVEVMEIREHPFFVGVQYHPEYKSTVEAPHPLFVAYVNAAIQMQAEKRRNAADIISILSA